MRRFVLISCEHGGNRVPSRYRPLFTGYAALLRTHRGYDPGSLRVARELATSLGAPLVASTITRLLIDLNRSAGRPDLYSECSAGIDPALRDELFFRYYLPYRTKVESRLAQALDAGAEVLHISCHSFTPELHGTVRDADIGLLFDPQRVPEARFCERWRQALLDLAPGLNVRMNYPYLGTADGLTTALRARFGAEAPYVGIELEINQKHVRDARRWSGIRAGIRTALALALGCSQPVSLPPS